MAEAASSAGDDPTIKTVSKATGVQRTLHVEWDPKTGTLVGMPAVWAQHLPSGLTREEVHVDGSAGKEIAPAAPQRQVKKALASKPADSSAKSFISKPFNFQHKFHVKMDQRASTGFTGLPQKWRTMLKTSGLSK